MSLIDGITEEDIEKWLKDDRDKRLELVDIFNKELGMDIKTKNRGSLTRREKND